VLEHHKIFAFVLLSVILAVSGSNDGGNGSVTAVSVDPGQAERSFTVAWYPFLHPREISLTGIEISLHDNDTKERASAVEFQITTILQTAMAFTYYEESGDLPPPNSTNGTFTNVKEAFFAFIFEFYIPFEYKEVNGIPGFQNGTGGDIITGFYNLTYPLLPWKDFVIVQTNITGTDGKQYNLFYITAETMDEVFSMRFTVAGTNVKVPGAVLTADSCKIDIAIRWFTDLHVAAAWTDGPSDPNDFPDAQVGLIVAMGALAEEAQSGSGSGNQNPSLNFTGTDFVAYFDWVDSAEVTDKNGNTAAEDVYALVLEVEEEVSQSGMNGQFVAGWTIRLIFFSFGGARPSAVIWDPSLGAVPVQNSTIVSTSTAGKESTKSDSIVYAPALFLIMLVLSLLF